MAISEKTAMVNHFFFFTDLGINESSRKETGSEVSEDYEKGC